MLMMTEFSMSEAIKLLFIVILQTSTLTKSYL